MSTASLRESGKASDRNRDSGFDEPDDEPFGACGLLRGDKRCAQSGDAESYAAPSGDGGERAGTLHGFANETKILASVVVDGYGSARAMRRFRNAHGSKNSGGADSCQVLCFAKWRFGRECALRGNSGGAMLIWLLKGKGSGL